jgi:hypothetical protein
MMCIIFGNNNVLTMSFGKDSMYEPAIKFFWNIQMNSEYIFLLFQWWYIYSAKKEFFASKENYLYWSWNDCASIFLMSSIKLQWITCFMYYEKL